MTSAPWPGCHGVRVDSDTLDLGRSTGTPLAEVAIHVGPVAPVSGEHLWDVLAEATVGGELLSVTRDLHCRPDGTLALAASRGPWLEIDPSASEITIGPGDEAVQLQLVATIALPLVLHRHDAVVFHASACARDGRAILVCGDSGAGKSSMLAALVDAGWQAVSEDMCAVDLRDGRAQVWPGPPWVRLAHGRAGPDGSRARFETPDKTGWDIAARQTATVTPINRVVLLDGPGGEAPSVEPVSHQAAVKALARHAVWLGRPDERSRRLFGPVVEMATRVEAVRVRFPFSPSWLGDVAGFVDAII